MTTEGGPYVRQRSGILEGVECIWIGQVLCATNQTRIVVCQTFDVSRKNEDYSHKNI